MRKLKVGDTVRVVAPSRSNAIIGAETREIAERNLQGLGLSLTYGKHVEEIDDFISSSVKARVSDLHAAYQDQSVAAIFTSIGGFNVNQILSLLDYQLIKENPKILCGYSDITALLNAVHAKTGQITYLGPHYSTLGMKKGLEYTLGQFRKCLMEDEAFHLPASEQFSDDVWYVDQNRREFQKNLGYVSIQDGNATGILLGGNLCTYQLLNGTEFQPLHEDIILIVEECIDNPETFLFHFDRNLQSLIHQKWFFKVRAILIGRFQVGSGMTIERVKELVSAKSELRGIPVIANVDSGHTTPTATLPIGGQIKIVASGKNSQIIVERH